MSLYPPVDDGGAPDFTIDYGQTPPVRVGVRNPSIHTELDDGFLAKYGPVEVRWRFEDGAVASVDLTIREPRTRLHREVQRFRDIQFTSREERVGQVVHELVLVPSTFFNPSRVPFHASALKEPGGGVVLVGGTGGVGKTSLALELCRDGHFEFVSDDIAVADSAGHVWPNLAYPKVYGYNLAGDPKLADLLLRDRSLMDRSNWFLRRRQGADRVRRRVSPETLFPAHSKLGGPLSRYYFLSREYRDDISVERVDPGTLARISAAVLQAEYTAFTQHLHWHVVNRSLTGRDPVVTVDEIVAGWEDLGARILADARCHVVRVPVQMEHRRFKERLKRLILADEA